jgi:hypothetical protein
VLFPSQYIFNHIPKTGGTSLLAVCRENLPPEDVSPHLVDLEIRYRTPAQFENYRLINGHFGVLTQMGFCRNRYSISMLRDPIKRLISTYSFYRIATEGGLLKRQARKLSFAEFVRYFQDSPTVVHNPYCHHFAAVGPDFCEYPADETTLLAIAKQNLAAFDFVGISEEFDGSIRLLCRELGWPMPQSIPHENRSFPEARVGQIDDETWETLEKRNDLDLQLYEYARRLLAEHDTNSKNQICSGLERNRFVPLGLPLRADRSAHIDSVSATWISGVASSQALELNVKFRCKSTIENLSLGIAIQDAGGRLVWGINTTDGELDLRFAAGHVTSASFFLECLLPAGPYTVTTALADERRLGFHEHWIDHAVQFTAHARQASAIRGVHSIRLLHFESRTFSDGQAVRRFPSAAVRLKDNADHELNSPENIASLLVLPFRTNGFSRQAIIDPDIKLSNPRVRLQLASDRVNKHSDTRQSLYVKVTNLGNEPLSSRYTFPVKLSYHWLSEDGTVKQQDGLRSNLSCDVFPGESSTHEVVIGPPVDPTCELVCITLVQEHVCWFDDFDLENRLQLRLNRVEAMSA